MQKSYCCIQHNSVPVGIGQILLSLTFVLPQCRAVDLSKVISDLYKGEKRIGFRGYFYMYSKLHAEVMQLFTCQPG